MFARGIWVFTAARGAKVSGVQPSLRPMRAGIRFFIADKALLLRGGPVAERFYLVICGLLGLFPLGLSLAGQGQAKELAP